jgi:hypothetical protein
LYIFRKGLGQPEDPHLPLAGTLLLPIVVEGVGWYSGPGTEPGI